MSELTKEEREIIASILLNLKWNGKEWEKISAIIKKLQSEPESNPETEGV